MDVSIYNQDGNFQYTGESSSTAMLDDYAAVTTEAINASNGGMMAHVGTGSANSSEPTRNILAIAYDGGLVWTSLTDPRTQERASSAE